MRLTAPQIATYAKAAGFSGVDVAIAVAVSLAESGGKTDAVNTKNKDGSRDYGLWQINSVHSDLLSSGRWDLPSDNARMAYSVWRSSGWSAWTTYNSGAYVSHLGAGNAAAANPAPVTGVTFTQQPIKIKLSTPTHWYGYNNQPIPPPPRKYVVYAKAPTRINLGGSDPPVIVPKGHWYVPQVSEYCASATGTNISDPRQKVMLKWLTLYWAGKFTPETMHLNSDPNKRDYTWLFSHTVVFQPKAKTEAGPPDPGIADPGLHLDPLGWLKDFISFITNPHNWLRLAFFIFGGLLLLFAAYKLADRTPPAAAASVGSIVEGAAA